MSDPLTVCRNQAVIPEQVMLELKSPFQSHVYYWIVKIKRCGLMCNRSYFHKDWRMQLIVLKHQVISLHLVSASFAVQSRRLQLWILWSGECAACKLQTVTTTPTEDVCASVYRWTMSSALTESLGVQDSFLYLPCSRGRGLRHQKVTCCIFTFFQPFLQVPCLIFRDLEEMCRV